LVSFSKTIALFGLADVHDFHPGIHFYFNGLGKDQVLHAASPASCRAAPKRAAQQSAGAERGLRMSRLRAILDRRSAQLAVRLIKKGGRYEE
jgi:hypothetical protein